MNLAEFLQGNLSILLAVIGHGVVLYTRLVRVEERLKVLQEDHVKRDVYDILEKRVEGHSDRLNALERAQGWKPREGDGA